MKELIEMLEAILAQGIVVEPIASRAYRIRLDLDEGEAEEQPTQQDASLTW